MSMSGTPKKKTDQSLIDEFLNKGGKVIKGTDKNLGGTMRLGLYEAKLKENSLVK